ncbi:dethiobiotin synthase [Gordonia sp. (in: high G+C Gram-positive bacteria)]|uniref:dethiobiotin synthase n=1 Tax=Gordonia sp. (in: high G+C Gram-positive bacteria) TaxID=84139 RepID=UPI0016ABA38D|nr:dethiobiotin synthase [Gordonia sp. (in: high G+C Gram-positive bacteria)]NLG46590.1 ATP-dependent dethiobiotin synthetase BioD [Gordonia sp. (in: high G+C Gram-positive bacteria)]
MSAQILVVTGTSTDIGKTVAVAAVAAAARAAGLQVGVCKAAQTGLAVDEPGDLADIRRLAGEIPTREPARFPEPLAPETAAARAGMAPVTLDAIVGAVAELAVDADLVLVEGAGGVLVRLAPDLTVLDVAVSLGADLLVVTDPGLGSLNHTELTTRAAEAAGAGVRGLVIGAWPAEPDLAMRCNIADLPRLTGAPIVATVPAGVGAMSEVDFRAAAPAWVDPRLFHSSPVDVPA